MTLWQGLGAFVYTSENLSTDTLDNFARIGGKWLVAVLYGDDAAGPENIKTISTLKRLGYSRGITTGCWANCRAGDPAADAAGISNLVKMYGLDPVILDCEAEYQEHPDVFPQLLKAVRKQLPAWNMGVSTNSLNDSLIWNGRGLNPRESARKLGYRVLPQWYSSPAYTGPWADPKQNMQWLNANGMVDNFLDPTYKNHRAVPLSYVHGTLEVTGLEGASLEASIESLHAAQPYGYSTGFSVYTLENMPPEDFVAISAVRGRLYV